MLSGDGQRLQFVHDIVSAKNAEHIMSQVCTVVSSTVAEVEQESATDVLFSASLWFGMYSCVFHVCYVHMYNVWELI